MRQHGARRGYRIDHIARQFDARHDFADFDFIVVMDDENYHDICRKAHSEIDRRKVIRMADYFTKYKGRTSVPDPYYGDGEDFELALGSITTTDSSYDLPHRLTPVTTFTIPSCWLAISLLR